MYHIAFSFILLLGTLSSLTSLAQHENDSDFVIVTETLAKFQGRTDRFGMYVSAKLAMIPTIHNKKNIGTIFMQFFIGKDGFVESDSLRNLTQEEALKSMHYTGPIITNRSLIKKIQRIILQSPQWQPGMQDGKPVRQKFIIPLTIN